MQKTRHQKSHASVPLNLNFLAYSEVFPSFPGENGDPGTPPEEVESPRKKEHHHHKHLNNRRAGGKFYLHLPHQSHTHWGFQPTVYFAKFVLAFRGNNLVCDNLPNFRDHFCGIKIL